MKPLKQLMSAIGAAPLVSGNAEIHELTTDSRNAGPGTLFMARVGAAADGHDFIEQAVAGGASAILVTRPSAVPANITVPVFSVRSQDPTYGLLAAEFFEHPTRELNVYGITGTNGKSSTAWMLDHLLRALGQKVALISTLGYRVGDTLLPAPNTTPDALVIQRLARHAVNAGCHSMVMEVSSHGLALGRVAGVQFRAGGWTNFSRDHLDFHGTEEEYFRAKALFFSLFLRQQPSPAHAIMVEHEGVEALQDFSAKPPVFDKALDYLKALQKPDAPIAHQTLISVGKRPHADVHIEALVSSTVRGTAVRLIEGDQEHDGIVPVAGTFQIENAALAMALVQRIEGTSWTTLLEAMMKFPGVPGRMELVADPQDGEPAVFVDYAHTPDAVAAVLDTARGLREHTLSVVVGCGGDRDRGKRPHMAHAALTYADRSVFTSDNPRSEDPERILDDMFTAENAKSQAIRIVNRRTAIARGIDEGGNGVCVIAGKGHEAYEEINGRRWLWRDTDEARMHIAKTRYRHELPRRLSGWSPEHLAQVLDGHWLRAPDRILFGGLSTDTRSLVPGDLFVALKGPRFDAHDHLQSAFDKGAVAAVVSMPVSDAQGPQLLVASTHDALAMLARALIDEARAARGGLQVIALTGSNGKTTTRSFATALALLRDGRAPLATHGNFNNQIGLPLSTAPLSTAHHRAILEMGANQHGDIAELVQMAPPDVAVLTSIAPSHLEGFGSVDGIRKAKAEMLRYATPCVVIMPHSEVDGVWGVEARAAGTQILTFGGEGAGLYCTRESVNGPVILEGRSIWPGFRAAVDVPVPGRHNAGNFAAALLATSVQDGKLLQPPTAQELAAFAQTLVAPPGRMEQYDVAERHVIFDAYNANPGSVRAAIHVLRDFPSPRIAVLGELLELGEEEGPLHRAVLEEAADCCDVVITVGERWPTLSYSHVHRCLDREHAVRTTIECTPEGATLLWKGSRGARLEFARDEVESIWQKREY